MTPGAPSPPAVLDPPAEPAGGAAPPLRRRWEVRSPWSLLVGAALFATGLVAGRSVLETDVFWHVRLGQDILAGRGLSGAGWSYTTPHSAWRSTEWLGEVALAAAHDTFGWRGVIGLRLALALMLVGGLGVTLLRGKSVRARALVFVPVAASAVNSIEERPQLLSFVLLVWVAAWARTSLHGGRPVRWWVLLPVTLLWAQVHGYWLLVPAVLVLLCVCRLLDGDRAAVLPLAARAVAVVAVACVNPLGPSLLVSPIRLHAATAIIQEWRPSNAAAPNFWLLLALVAGLVWAWSRRGVGAGHGELLYAAAVVAYGFSALRNLTPAALLLAPVVAERLAAVWPEREQLGTTERRVLGAAQAVLVVGGVVAGTVNALTVPAVQPSSTPLAIAAALRTEPGPRRVVNGYNVSGRLLAFAGPGVQVAVDGRSDRYGNRYLLDYVGMLNMTPGWEGRFSELAPTDIVLATGTPLAYHLAGHGWHVVLTDQGYELLQPDDPTMVPTVPAACLPGCL